MLDLLRLVCEEMRQKSRSNRTRHRSKHLLAMRVYSGWVSEDTALPHRAESEFRCTDGDQLGRRSRLSVIRKF